MRRNKLAIAAIAMAVSTATSVTAFAAGWQPEGNRWWYENEDGSYQQNGWFTDSDGKQYYFDSNGYMLADTVTPDGYTVGEDGAWIPDSENTTSVSNDGFVGVWKLQEVKTGWLDSQELVSDLKNFSNMYHWSDWQISFLGAEEIHIVKEGDQYYCEINSEVKYPFTVNGTKGLAYGENDYFFLDGDRMAVTGKEKFFIVNANDYSGNYFIGYYTRE